MNKFRSYAISSIVVMSLIFIPLISVQVESVPLDAPLAGPYISMSENLTIDGDGEFNDYSYITGDGSKNDPFVISGLNMSSHSIIIKNTTSYLNITDLEWGFSDEYRLVFRNNDHIRLENLVMNSEYIIEGDRCPDLNIVRCNLTSSLWNIMPISFLNVSSLFIENSTFSNNNICYYEFSGYLGTTNIINSTFTRILIGISIPGTQKIERSRFTSSGLSPKGMSNSSVISDCIFTGDFAASNQGLKLTRGTADCDNGVIRDNTFKNLQCGIDLQGQYSNAPRIKIFNNSFETCRTWGIRLNSYNTDIFNNTFRNTFRYAIFISAMGSQNIIWMNRFINNQVAAPGNPQSYSFSSSNDWDNGSIGNYWNDHISPDEEGNGIVDTPYILLGLGIESDNFPVTNINFDLDRPDVSFTTLSSGYSDRSYHRIGWESEDEWGIQKVELNGTDGKWTNVTGKDLVTVFLEQGTHNFSLKATDNSGLISFSDLDLEINQTVPVLKITNLSDGCYIDSDPVTIDWTIVDHFPVNELNISLDGEWTQLDTENRSRNLDLIEGPHTLSIWMIDDEKMQIREELEFTVDRTDPVIELEGPSPGSILSSQSVNFEYRVFESIRINRVRYRFDDEDWNTTDNNASIWKLLEGGEHLFKVEALDMAGHLTEIEVPFEVSTENIVEIISPLNGTFFSSNLLSLEWGYDGEFDWSSALLRVGLKNDFISIGDIFNYEMIFPEDGEYLITLRLKDDIGNYIQSDMYVTKDSKNPTVGFIGIKDGDYIRYGNLTLNWNALDNNGINNYQLRLDDGTWEDMGQDVSSNLNLDEGEHIVRIRAFDLAGNWDEAQIEFIVDMTAPVLSFKEQNIEIYTSPQIKIEWECEDNFGIERMDLIVEGRESRDVFGIENMIIALTEDGDYNVTLNASDMARNNASISMIITIDQTEPKANWVGEPIGISIEGEFIIKWKIEEYMGIKELFLEIDGERTDLDIDDKEYLLNLQEGQHTISLTVVDTAGWECVLDYPNKVLIDPTEPTLKIDESTSVTEGVASLSWTAIDDTSNIETIYISLDGGAFIELQKNSYTTEKLPLGDHSLTIKVTDTAGNVAEKTWTFTVEAEQSRDVEEGGSLMILILVIVVILVAITAGAGLIIYKKFGRKKNEEKVENDEDDPTKQLGQNPFLSAPLALSGSQQVGSTLRTLPPAQSPQQPQIKPAVTTSPLKPTSENDQVRDE